ncbi:pyridoxamine 5'-phosphate oxidase [bacterium YEK0313]|nr:pyridoxamine 5'-phosphate oxidase [bacterium YEK0313]
MRDDLDALRREAWALIVAAVTDGRAPFHTSTIATTDGAGAPRLRTVVLRAADAAAGTVRFHTDLRSAKADELSGDPRTAVHFFDPARKVQVQLAGRAVIAGVADEGGRSAWETARPSSRTGYGVMPGPGTPIAGGGSYRLPGTAAEIAAGAAHFGAVTVTADRLDWLSLDATGHRRARFVRTATAWQGTWLVP